MKYVNINKTSRQPTKSKLAKPQIRKKRYLVLIAGIVILGLAGIYRTQLIQLISPQTLVTNINKIELKQTDGRTNLLLLGLDRRTNGAIKSTLTDTLLIISIGHVDKDISLISLPRDLWVEVIEPTKSHYSKINEVYYWGNYKGAELGIKELTGGGEVSKVATTVTGLPIHYYAVIDFNVFKEVMDIIGGIEVTVDRTFTDYFYPVEGKENAPDSERYETITFTKGLQKMDGETALKFVRSRKGTNFEDTDFARSARQQKVIMAIKDKVLSIKTIFNFSKLAELYNTYINNVDTNLGLKDVQDLYTLASKFDFANTKTMVLDDRSAAEVGGLLYSPEDTSLYGGAYVLLPKAGDYSQLHAYIQQFIFGR